MMKSLIKLAVLLIAAKTIEKNSKNSVKVDNAKLNKFLENHIENISNVVSAKDLFEEEVKKKANHSVSVDDFFGWRGVTLFIFFVKFLTV